MVNQERYTVHIAVDLDKLSLERIESIAFCVSSSCLSYLSALEVKGGRCCVCLDADALAIHLFCLSVIDIKSILLPVSTIGLQRARVG